jgi:hypothetical protein
MAGQMPMQNAAVREAIERWSIGDRVDNGPKVMFEGQNMRGYPKEKTIWGKVDGRSQPIMSIPYAVEKYQDKARNTRFESTRNPSREDIDLVANRFIEGLREAGVPNNATLIQVPSSKASITEYGEPAQGVDNMAPMALVKWRMQELGFGRNDGEGEIFNSGLWRKYDAPSRTSIHEGGELQEPHGAYSGMSHPVRVGDAFFPRFVGGSDLVKVLSEAGLGRNRSIGEDYRSLTAVPDSIDLGNSVVLMDDSVNQGTSMIASGLRLQDRGANVTPITYWGYAGAPARPQMSLKSGDTVSDFVEKDKDAMMLAVLRAMRSGGHADEEWQRYVTNATELHAGWGG